MRVWGYVLLAVCGISFIFFVLAEIGGAHLNVIAFLWIVLLSATGVTLVRSGTPLVAPVSATTAGTPSTVQMPMSPEIATVIKTQSARSWRTVLYIAGGFFVLFVAMGAIFAATDKTPGEGATFLAFFAALGIACAALILSLSWATTRRPVNRDLREPTYLRTVGPVRVVPLTMGGAMLRLSDRAFLISGRAGIRELGTMSAGTLDYTPYGHIILAAWNDRGQRVYCAPGYAASP